VERGRAKVPFSEIKMMLDWYPFTYQTKATPYFVPILAKTFVFTSCVPPELWYVTESEKQSRSGRDVCATSETFGILARRCRRQSDRLRCGEQHDDDTLRQRT